MAGKDHLDDSPDDDDKRAPDPSTTSREGDAEHVEKKLDLAAKKPAARAFVAEQLGIDVRNVQVGIRLNESGPPTSLQIGITTPERPAGEFPTEFEGTPLHVEWIGELEPL